MNDNRDETFLSESRLEELRRRLEASRTTIEEGIDLTEEEKERILKGRAKDLAKETAGEEGADTRIWVVEFVLAKERYGIEPDFVRDVFPVKILTPLPGTPAFVLGITNMRGEILSVIDLKRFFDIPDVGIGDRAKVLVLESETMVFGFLVDSVIGTRSIPLDSIQPALPTLTEIRRKYLKGVTNDRMAVLDGEAILGDETLIVNQGVH
ncbi:MAG: purine-binding chemotaxis protein CheW [Spirochaetales bacterium]|nr:purine-binding chemotaxis protein CheW [Spirochaetales bacterium]